VKRLLWIATAGTALVALWLIFGHSPEADLRARASELTEAVEDWVNDPSGSSSRKLGDLLDPDIVVRTPELAPQGQDAVLGSLTEVSRGVSLPELSLDELEIGIAPSGQKARVSGQATWTAHTDVGVISDKRRVILDFRNSGNVWRVAFVDLAAKSNEQPEARP
jgi:hypothetical protein